MLLYLIFRYLHFQDELILACLTRTAKLTVHSAKENGLYIWEAKCREIRKHRSWGPQRSEAIFWCLRRTTTNSWTFNLPEYFWSESIKFSNRSEIDWLMMWFRSWSLLIRIVYCWLLTHWSSIIRSWVFGRWRWELRCSIMNRWLWGRKW